jgi:hypothetical protein
LSPLSNKEIMNFLFIVLVIRLLEFVTAFLPTLPKTHHHQRTSSFSSSCPELVLASSPQKNAEFEYQELKIQTNAIVDQEVTSARLSIEKRKELEGYCRLVVNRKESPIPLYRIADNLLGEWQLAFTTQALSLESLPRDAITKLDFKNKSSVDYILEFSKTFGLNRLVAQSSYTVDVS